MKRGLLAMFLVLAMVCSGSFWLAQAEDLQSALVVDKADVFKGSIVKVEKAAQELQSVGADVRIWTIPSYAGEANSLDDYFEKLLAKFPTWRSPDGGKKNNLIVLMVSLKERKTGLYYGEEWSRPLERNWTRVQTDFMNPLFKRGEFAEGFAAGLGEVKDLIYEHLHPKAVPAQTASSQPIIIQQGAPSEPTDLSGLWSLMKWMIGIFVSVVITVLAFMFIKNQRKIREEKQETQQRAKIEKLNVSKKITSIRTEAKEIEELVNMLKSSVQAKLIEKFKFNLANIKENVSSITQDFSATSSSAGDPESPNLTKSQYQAIETKFSEISRPIEKVLKDFSDLKEELIQLRNDVVAIPDLIAELEKDLAETEKVFQAVQEKGFKTTSVEAILAEGKSMVEEVKQLLAEKAITGLVNKIKEAEAKILEAQEEALKLPDIKSRIDSDIKRVEVRGPEIIQEIAKGKEAFQRLNENFVSGSLESIRGNGTEAEKRVALAASVLDQAKAKASMDEQDWVEADKFIVEANECLSQAASLMKSIFSLEHHLDEAKANVEAEVAEVEQGVGKAWSYIEKFDDDIRENLEDDLQQAEQMITDAKAELSKDLPDYIVAFKMAQKANALADKIYAEAVEEHEALERERKKAEAQKQSAEAALSRTREYFEDHGSDIDSDAKQRLKDAEKALRNAEDQADTAQFIVLTTLSQQEANKAYKLAKEDVSSAEQSRNISWGSSHHYGGGGSTSFGGSFGGGGGSTSWGGGGGGGGSTSW